MSPANRMNHEEKQEDDRSTGSGNSNVPQFLRGVLPMDTMNQLSEFLPKAAANLFAGVSGANTTETNHNNNNTANNNNHQHADFDGMLFDAVPFNGDTDNSQGSTVLPDFTAMNIDVPLAKFGSNISNISPIGNVSSRVPFDEQEDDSDDDLDRILGTMKAGLRGEHHHHQQQLRSSKGKHNASHKGGGGELLNTTLPTLFDASSSLEGEEEEAATALGECVFHPSTNPSPLESGGGYDQRAMSEMTNGMSDISNLSKDDEGFPKETVWSRFRSRAITKWLILLCLLLILVVAVMVGLMVPSAFSKRSNDAASAVVASSQAEDFASSDATATETETVESIPEESPTMKPSFLRPSQQTTERIPTEIPTSLPTTSSPTGKPFLTWSERYPQFDPQSEDFEMIDENQGGRESLREDDRLREDERGRERLPLVRLEMGPLVGHTTHESVTLWAYYQKPAIYLFEENYSLEIMLYDSDGWLRTIGEAEPDPEKNNAVFATITNLEPLKDYRFEMKIMGQVVGSGSFQTAPAPSNSGTFFEYVLASCMDRSEYPFQEAWGAISTLQPDGTRDYPDFAILAGDTIYLQEGVDVDGFWGVDFDRYWYRSYEQRTEPYFANFVSNTPIYAVWNNHDYGSDVSDRDQIGKEQSLRAWNSLWPNPESPGSSNMFNPTGIYYSFYWGDVHYIVTDDHWNRNPMIENRWGYAQTEWIRSELLSSTGTFKVIVIGSDIMERDWRSDLENIGATVRENSINGVVFHAGDIHRNEYKRRQTEEFPYPVTQITSSGIAKVWRRPFAKIAVDTRVEDPTMTVRFFGATSMEDDTTWTNDPELVCSTVELGDREGEHSCTQTIRLSDVSM